MVLIVSSTATARGRIHHGKVMRLTAPGGMVWTWQARHARTARVAATRFAPVRTGALAASVYADLRSNQYRATLRLGARADHAQYVVKGTLPISGKMRLYGGVLLGTRLPSAALSRYRDWSGSIGKEKVMVDGQRANNFLSKALRYTYREYGVSVPG